MCLRLIEKVYSDIFITPKKRRCVCEYHIYTNNLDGIKEFMTIGYLENSNHTYKITIHYDPDKQSIITTPCSRSEYPPRGMYMVEGHKHDKEYPFDINAYEDNESLYKAIISLAKRSYNEYLMWKE